MSEYRLDLPDLLVIEKDQPSLDIARVNFARANFYDALGINKDPAGALNTKVFGENYQSQLAKSAANEVLFTIEAFADSTGIVDLHADSEIADYKISVADNLSQQVGSYILGEHLRRLDYYFRESMSNDKMSWANKDAMFDLFYGSVADSTKTIRHNDSEDALKVNVALFALITETGGKVSQEDIVSKIKSVVRTCAGVTDPFAEYLWLRDIIKPVSFIAKTSRSGILKRLIGISQ